MEYSYIELDGALIRNADDSVRTFIEEWNNGLPYIVAHTSGSTGKPKEIRLPKGDMLQSAAATCRRFGITGGSVMVLPLSVDYIAGKMMVVRAMVSKSVLWIEQPSNHPIKSNYGTIDLLPVVPSQVAWLLDNTQIIEKIRCLIIGGGAVSPEMESRLRQLGINAYATYGMTETCSHVALRDIGSGTSVYEALPGISFGIDERGCLVVNAPEFSFGKLVTNDIANLIDSYHFEWMGRWDNVINTGGIKVFPEMMEQRVASVVVLPRFYFIGRPSTKWGEEVVMYIESGPQSSAVNENIILSQIGKVLNCYEMPKEIITVREFERTASGKIKRLLL